MRVKRSRCQIALGRGSLAAALLMVASVIPRSTPVLATTASSLPLTTSGIHLGMDDNYNEPTVNGYKTQEGNVDYVFGADGGMRNVPAMPGGAFHDKYLSWPRDAAGGGFAEPISWYKTYHPDWLLYENDRTTIPVIWGDNVAPLDFTNPAVQQYIINTWIDPALAGGFQGVSFDNDLGFNYLHAAGHYDAAGNWVQLYSGNEEDPAYASAQATAFAQVVAEVHATHPGATVGINQGVDCTADMSLNEAGQQYADLVIDQEGFTNSANTSLPYIAQYPTAVCPQGKWLEVASWAQHLQRDLGEGLFLINPEPYNVAPYQTNTDPQARFDLQWSLANYLLVKYDHTYFWWGSWAAQNGYVPAMQSEYTTAQAIGSPTDDFYASQNVYMRDFSNGLAVVNPDRRNSYSVSFPAGKYQDLYGSPITSYTMPAHSGLILLGMPGATGIGVPPPTPTNTPFPSPRPTRTPIPTPTRTPAPARPPIPRRPAPQLVIAKVQILHRVHGRLVDTTVLSPGEDATFLVQYTVRPAGARRPTATLLITHGGKVIARVRMTPHKVSGHPGFAVTLVFAQGLSGKYWTHFVLRVGAVSVQRARKLTLNSRPPSR